LSPNFKGVKTLTPKSNEVINQPHPEWMRLPKNGKRCALTGLSRTTLFTLATQPKSAPQVLSKVIKTRQQASKGIRLINVRSLLDFIASSDSKES
jgi:hypothetical protein